MLIYTTEWNEKYVLISTHLLPLFGGETSNACLAQREILDHCYFKGQQQSKLPSSYDTYVYIHIYI